MKKKLSERGLILLHLLLAVYSLEGVCSKIASGYEFFSFQFILCYGALILILGIYAICWQQIIKRMPLTVAYANKAVTVVWGIVWGWLIFDERVSINKFVGAAFIIAGIVLFAFSGDKEERDEH